MRTTSGTQIAEADERDKEFEDGDDKTDHVGKRSVDFLGEDVPRPRFLIFGTELGILQVDDLWVIGCEWVAGCERKQDGEVVGGAFDAAIR